MSFLGSEQIASWISPAAHEQLTQAKETKAAGGTPAVDVGQYFGTVGKTIETDIDKGIADVLNPFQELFGKFLLPIIIVGAIILVVVVIK